MMPISGRLSGTALEQQDARVLSKLLAEHARAVTRQRVSLAEVAAALSTRSIGVWLLPPRLNTMRILIPFRERPLRAALAGAPLELADPAPKRTASTPPSTAESLALRNPGAAD